MAERLIKDRAGVTETATAITITKTNFAFPGYTPREQMTEDEFITALLRWFGQDLTSDNASSNPDQSVIITLPTEDDVTIGGTAPNRYYAFPFQVEARQAAPSITLVPSNI